MKKIGLFLIMAATLLAPSIGANASHKKCCPPKCCPPVCQKKCPCPSPEFGYFYVTNDDFATLGSLEEVFWFLASSVHTDDIFIDPSDPCDILLKKPGLYLATYIVTGEIQTATKEQPSNGFQFALYLNRDIGTSPIPGSTYGTGQAFPGQEPNIGGRVIFRVTERNSTLALVNQCENTVILDNDVGTDNVQEFGNNVSVSLYVQRLSSLGFE